MVAISGFISHSDGIEVRVALATELMLAMAQAMSIRNAHFGGAGEDGISDGGGGRDGPKTCDGRHADAWSVA